MSANQSHTKQNGHAGPHTIRDSAQQIWLVGRGAYETVEGGGRKVFERLLSVGNAVEKEARQRVAAPAEIAKRNWSEVRITATDAWEHLEKAFERRVAKALNSLQIPTHRDVRELSARVSELQKAVDRLSRRPSAGGARKTTRKAGASRTTTRTRKSTARKPKARAAKKKTVSRKAV